MRHGVDHPRDGDEAAIAAALTARLREAGWDADVRPFLRDAPEHVVIARDAAERLHGFCIGATPASRSTVVRRDRILGPWLTTPRPRSPATRCSSDATRPISAPAARATSTHRSSR